jgi:GT2 family glycosyltransferase
LITSANTGVITRLFKHNDVPLPVSDAVSYPDWTSFACVMVRDRVFREIGLMDDEFFMYFEDADFSYRAQKKGWTVVNNPAARVVHLRGGSSPVKEQTKLGKRLPKYYYESRTRYYYKIYGRTGLILANLLWWLGRGLSITRELFGRKVRNTCDRQWIDIWTNWLHPKREYTRP